jgi:hypothetical protein
MSAASPEQIAAHFVRRDADLKTHAKQLAPIRKERKALHDHLLKVLEENPSLEQITLSDGTIVRLKEAESTAPVKEEYVAERLVEIMGVAAPQAAEVARRIWEDRPKTTKHKLVYEAPASTDAPAASRKRSRKPQQE